MFGLCLFILKSFQNVLFRCIDNLFIILSVISSLFINKSNKKRKIILA